jgi:hypothetical protein
MLELKFPYKASGLRFSLPLKRWKPEKYAYRNANEELVTFV